MEFLKTLFDGGALTYDQLLAKTQAGKMNVVNIADGSYVSRHKFDDAVNGLKQQVTDLQGQISQRDTDMSALNEKLTAAQADASKLTDAQTALTGLQTKYDADKRNWEAKTAAQAYEFAVKTAANQYKFSSAAAQREFVRGAIDAGLKMDGDTILGFGDYVSKFRTDDPGAIVDQQNEPEATPPKPAIVLPTGHTAPEQSVFGFHFNGVRPKE